MSDKITISIPAEQKDFLNLIIHEDAAANLSGAVQWCIDACMRIEKLYELDACHISFNDIRKELQSENDEYHKALSEIVRASQHLKENPNCAYILKVAEEALKQEQKKSPAIKPGKNKRFR